MYYFIRSETTMILTGGKVMCEDFKIRQLDVEIQGEKIVKIGENLRGEKTDVSGKYILPGFIDTHIHGAYGARIGDKSTDIKKITDFEVTQGVTAIAITTGSSDFESLLCQFDAAVEANRNPSGTKIAAIHAEGPFLSKTFKGAMNEKNLISPDNEKLKMMIDRGCGLLRIITVAPEVEGAIEFIQAAARAGIAVSVGHTNATYDEAMAAFRAGATQATHTFNAMRPYNHREPGVLGAVLTTESICCEMICDYVHLHPATIQLIYKAKGADNIRMVSDSGHAAGLEISEFDVDGIKRYVKDGVVRLENGTIAGSAMTLLNGVKNLANSGIPLEDISKMVSYNPAKVLKIQAETGSLAEGKLADIAVLDGNLNVAATFINGKCVYNKSLQI